MVRNNQTADNLAKQRWQGTIEAFKPLTRTPEDVFAGTREGERALNVFNRAVEQLQQGHGDIALIALDKLTATYPLFVEAAFLYGLALATVERYREAEECFAKAILSKPTRDQAEAFAILRREVKEARIKAEVKQSAGKRKESKLLPVRAVMAKENILQRAVPGSSQDNAQMASDKEIKAVLRQLELGENNALTRAEISSGNEVVKKRIFLGIIVALAVVAVILIVFVKKLSIVEDANNALERVTWLEHKLAEREGDSAVADILKQYKNAFPDK